MGNANAEPIYYYTGNSETGAATDEENWKGADGKSVTGIIAKTEGNRNEYRFQSGIYDGGKTVGDAWLIADGTDIKIISEGPLTIQNWRPDLIPVKQGVITSTGGKIIFGDNVSFLNNYSSGEATKGGGAIYSNKGVTFGENAKLISNQAAVVIGPWSQSNGGGAIFVDGDADSAVIFGKNALVEKNEAVRGGAIDASGSVTFGESAIIRENSAITDGGAIRVHGILTLNQNTLVESNKVAAEKATGGAFYIEGTANISGTTLKNNTAANGGSGGAFYLKDGFLNLSDETVVEGNEASKGGAVYANSSTININHTTLKNNTANGNGGALYVTSGSITTQSESGKLATTSTVFQNNTASSYGGAIYAQLSDVHLGSGTRFEENQAGSLGGAITVVQGSLSMTDTAFINNSSSQKGGAIYLQTGNLDFNVTKTSPTPIISGNTSGAGGFLYLLSASSANFNIAQGQQLQIGDVNYFGTDNNRDSLYISSDSAIKKTGGGEMKINSSMSSIWGTVSVEEGILSVAQHWNIRNAVSVTGGTLDSSSFSFVGDNASLTINGGTLLTDTSHIFETALGSEGRDEDAGKLKEHIDFKKGLISFNDAKYNLKYASSAAGILGVDKTSGREIIFTGNLYDNSGNASSSVSISDLNSSGLSNMVLGGATLTTGTDSKGNNLVVGASSGSHGSAESIEGSIGGSNLNLGTDGSEVTITGGQYLTLLGGETNTSLVQAGNEGNKAVDVHVGSTNSATPEGTLNLGTTGMASSGTLTGNVQIGSSSIVNVRGGEHSITGESDSTAGQAVAGINNNGGTLNIDEHATLQTSVKQTTGETNIAGKLASSSVELEGGNFNVSGSAQIEQLKQRGGDTVISGTVEGNSLEVAGGTMNVTGTLKTENLVANSGMTISVGNGSAAGKLSSSSVSLNGGGIFLDPAWIGNDTVETASHGALVFNNQTVDGELTVGQNSLLVLGETSVDRSIDMFNTSGLKWGKDDISAALSITAAQHLSPTQGAIVVDGSKTSAPTSPLAPNTATFANGSLLIVDASGLNGNAALSSEGGALYVNQNASLLIGNATTGKYVITSGFADNANVKGWEGDYLSSTDQLIGLTIDKSETGTIKVEARALDVASTLPGVVMPGTISEIWFGGRNDIDSSNACIAFLSRTMDNRYLAPNDTVRTINGAAQIAIAAGVQASAISASGSVNRALQDHLSLSNSVNQRGAPSLHREGPDLWASMLYRDSDSSGIRAGRFNADYKNDFGGIVAGADYTWKDKGNGSFRAGGALNIGTGEGKSRGDFNDTRNDYDTYGLSAYGSLNSGNANLMVDIGYMKGKNELKQTVPSTLGDTLKADVDTQIWTIGAQGEYRLKTATFDVTPHIGVRWLRLKTDAFKTHNSQGTVFNTGSDTQNIWQIPVGVTLSRDYVAKNGWTVKPKLDISFIPATGDRNASTRIHVPGVAASDITRTEIMDSTSWNGSLGLDMQKDRLSIGFSAAYQKSGNEKSRGFMLKINRQFD
ncbi:autotransporter outer membrane beta-barrel domain-containing protein [Oxalobacter formigenes]